MQGEILKYLVNLGTIHTSISKLRCKVDSLVAFVVSIDLQKCMPIGPNIRDETRAGTLEEFSRDRPLCTPHNKSHKNHCNFDFY
mmetsp:Transcript_44963/g.137336  ORF Transcript_44963/g.137336 Transcript_44963/m.137336 type:complete len:84 (-) Transcript_44963:776-1027(-)